MKALIIILIFTLLGCSNKTNNTSKNRIPQKENSFVFNGDWEFEYEFDAFKGLQSRRGPYTSLNSDTPSDGKVTVIITDELNDNPDPTNSQIATIEYISNHPQRIKQIMFSALKDYYPKVKEMYGYNPNDADHQTWFPTVHKIEDFKNVFGIGNVFIHIADKDGFSYYGLEAGCTWDDEHGLGFLFHKDRLIDIGQVDIAFSVWEAYKDNGTFEQKQKEWNEANNPDNLPKPIIYEPHPKYGKLKPLQIAENKMYENRLIERGYNDEFIDLVNQGKIDVNNNPGLTMTYLQRAAQFNNIEICEFLFNQNIENKKNIIQNAARHCNKDLVNLCLQNGIDINEKNNVNQTLYSNSQRQLKFAKKSDSPDIAKFEDFLNWIIEKGASE